MMCAWKTIYICRTGEYTFPVRIGHALAFPAFFDALKARSSKALASEGVSCSNLSNSLQSINILEDAKVFIEHCPISNHYLISPPEGSLWLHRHYSALPKKVKTVLGTDDPLFFGQVQSICGISIETADSSNPFLQMISFLKNNSSFKYTESHFETIWKFSTARNSFYLFMASCVLRLCITNRHTDANNAIGRTDDAVASLHSLCSAIGLHHKLQLMLDNTEANHILISGQSLSVGVPAPDSALYSIACDVIFRDDTIQYGHFVPFSSGTHGLETKYVSPTSSCLLFYMCIHFFFSLAENWKL